MNILQSSFRYGVLFFTLALATAGAGDPLVKIDSRVECPAGLIDKVKEEARKQRPEEIRKIWIGELNHPGRSFGARLEYAPECYGTYAIVRTFSAQIPGEPTTEYLPELKMERYGFRFKSGPFMDVRIRTNVLRIFPLKQTTLFFRLGDDLTYNQVLALLQAIEAGTLKRLGWEKEKPSNSQEQANGEVTDFSSLSDMVILSASNLSKIRCIRKVKEGFEITTDDSDFGVGSDVSGYEFTIQEKDGVYIVISAGRWRS